ncbi:MAG: type II toxin-antitoxin system HicB family antitoxin [Acidobacteriota bacterium]
MTKNYLVVFGKCTGSNFSGHAPDVPGCISAGDTLEEMRAMMREALELHFQGLAEYGEPIPEPKTINVEFKPQDFADVEYFVVQHIEVSVPANAVFETAKTDQAA